ncbi:HNH endonuclease [Chitinibacter fontanus]|uniref:HNH endonuclease n=1 Tax=Chitinibacter fontanus TaxID=1737446 RepID=A0A7D5Z1T2_9NEIS|nr:HNH endonuclease [Chitinibacter fontanus]QLI80861.1 HNH endonuclease [Chitinibacter fontanus]
MASPLSLLTSADAVRAAIAECDQLGRDEFLKKYGYKNSRLYPLEYQGNIYDSKAIAGVAYGYEHGTPLKASEFNGGVATVIPALARLGFNVMEANNPSIALVKGTTYFRKDLLAKYGGQLQCGIWTPKEFPVVLLFTGDNGKNYGYRDGWTEDGVFLYTGEGQTGDMTFTNGNLAIREHRNNGKDLLLFEDLGKGKGVRYIGLFECGSWHEKNGYDKKNQKRKLIIFNLIPVETAATDIETQLEAVNTSQSFEDLRAAAYAASKTNKAGSKASETKRSWYERSAKVSNYVLKRSKGICEACDQPAPFMKKNGTPYLEPHHTRRLADNGLDHPIWVGAICPTCHRRIHSGQDGIEWNKQLQTRLKKKEEEIGLLPTE